MALVYLAFLALCHVPMAQQWGAEKASRLLASLLHTRVEIARLELGHMSQVSIHGCRVFDQADSLMIDIDRLSARINPLALIEKKVHIHNAQLFNARFALRRDSLHTAPNFQFLVNALLSSDTTSHTPLHLQIGRVIMHNAAVAYHVQSQKHTPNSFNPHHLSLSDIHLNASVRQLSTDSAHIHLRALSLHEASGFQLHKMSFELKADSTRAELSHLHIALPHSTLSMPHLALHTSDHTKNLLHSHTGQGAIEAHLTPSDLATLVPNLKHWHSPLSLRTHIALQDHTLALHNLSIASQDQLLALQAEGTLNWQSRQVEATIHALSLKSELQSYLWKNMAGEDKPTHAMLGRLTQCTAHGTLHYTTNALQAQINAHTPLGATQMALTLRQGNQIDASLQVESLQLGTLLGEKTQHTLGQVSLQAHAKGWLKGKDNRPAINLRGQIDELEAKGHTYRQIAIEGGCSEQDYSLFMAMHDPLAQITLSAQGQLAQAQKHATLSLRARNVTPHALHLTPHLKDERISMAIEADLTGSSLQDMAGNLHLSQITLTSDSLGQIQPGNIHLFALQQGHTRQLTIESGLVNGTLQGEFHWAQLRPAFLHTMSAYLPSLFQAQAAPPCQMAFQFEIQDTALLSRLLNKPIRIPHKSLVQGYLSNSSQKLGLKVQMPELYTGSEHLSAIDINVQNMPQMLQTSIALHRHTKKQDIAWNLDNYMGYDKMRTSLQWTNHQDTARQSGSLGASSIFFTGRDGKPALYSRLNPSEIILNDTTWALTPAMVEYHDGVVDIKDFQLSQGAHHLSANGRISPQDSDSIHINLHNIRLEYIFQLINFHSVELAGEATGNIIAKTLTKKPNASAWLHIQNFHLNHAPMGEMDVYGNWGEHNKSIFLNAHIRDTQAQQTNVTGTITPGRGPHGGLDLHINTRHINLAFLNKFTKKVLDNLQGRASGTARVFGPFKNIDLEGDMLIHQAQLGIPTLGTRYTLQNNSVTLRPGLIEMPQARIFNSQSTPQTEGHQSIAHLTLRHHYLRNLRYELHLQANNLLAYNQPDLTDQSFGAIVYATGNATLKGQSGLMQLDAQITPQAGTQFIYNVATPETLTKASFISYISAADSLAANNPNATHPTHTPQQESDLFLNFDINLTPSTNIVLLMDRNDNDHIELNGNGHIQTQYHNKGKMRIYGTYQVDQGTYKLSLQDFIRKEFAFENTSTISFGGDPSRAALNLRAIHTLPNVSLDDLSSTSLGLSNTRVDCIMQIGGTPAAPAITFDFDLPNANEDEKQMVRTMVNSNEEKNLQAVHLLGIGRFYNSTIRYTQGGNQSTMAVNSLLSSTLSSQFNHLMSNMVGSKKITFGANLRTGEEGWRELDVEGILSGRFLNNRLLFNGNFGYRENLYTNNNFIGDFDVKYLITPTGTIALKAYNQTNDRYFTLSSLTTQGIGIQFKKDFNRLRSLFHSRQRKKKSK